MDSRVDHGKETHGPPGHELCSSKASHLSHGPFTLGDVLSVAKTHPFYVPSVQYPPDTETIRTARDNVSEGQDGANLESQPLLTKKQLYTTIERLVQDPSSDNTYRHAVYASITGGGSGSTPLFFATDVSENRQQRARFGQFIRKTGVIEHGDWVLTTHCSGELYRSLDLVLEILENAGASVLAAGNLVPPVELAQLIVKYHINVLAGDSSQVVQFVHYVSTLPREEQQKMKLNKIIYTSEVLTAAQRQHIITTLGQVKICSILGSAEAGAWAINHPDLVEKRAPSSAADFIFDTRTMLVEVVPPALAEGGSPSDYPPVPDGHRGVIVQTSLSRLRNPLVRYNTGDVGSLHLLPDHARARLSESDWPYLRVLRLEGRDGRFSFDWDGEYIDFSDLTKLITAEECGVLQWQTVLDTMQPSLESSLEFRLLASPRTEGLLSLEDLTQRLRKFVHAYSSNKHRFFVTFVQDLNGFELSKSGRKVIKFIDRYN